MSDMDDRIRTYAGETSDIILAIKEISKEMSDHKLREVVVDLPFSSGSAKIVIRR